MIEKRNNIVRFLLHLPKNLKMGLAFFGKKTQLMFLVMIYGMKITFDLLSRVPIVGRLMRPFTSRISESIYSFMSNIKVTESGISSINLIDLGARNIKYKKTRSFITIGGMAIGIGSIVFLVSLGYGAQRMVVGRVARLDELRQADIATQPGSKVVINDEQIARIKGFKDVAAVLPLISVVGRVNYQNSSTDMAVYGVTTQYLAESAERPIRGNVFTSNEMSQAMKNSPEDTGEIAGVMTKKVNAKIGDEVGIVNYNIVPDKWIRIRETPEKDGEIIGYARRFGGQSVGKLVVGSSYPDNEFGNIDSQGIDGEPLRAGKWIRDEFSLWEPTECDPANTDCDISGKYKQKKDSEGRPLTRPGYTAMINVSIYNLPVSVEEGSVLGIEGNSLDPANTKKSSDTVETIDITDIKASGSAMLALTEIASESAKTVAAVKQVDVAKSAKREAVVNRAMLAVLGIKEEQAVGKEFVVSFVVTGDLLGANTTKIESNPAKYKIVGVIPQATTPFFYVPFIDLRGLGIANFSQAKLVVKTQEMLEKTRQLTESLGFNTTSVVDTVAQIETLFGTIRLVLVSLGVVALGVAAMGMFNTLTVSLLERTHEVGLMKTMGMKSAEVEDLFLIESVVMGLFGGVAGILFGFVSGKLLSLVLTIIATRSGAGIIDISYVPFSFVAGIMLVSLFVGLITGIYPAYRARHISALNALRYE